MNSVIERTKDFFSRLFASKRASTIFIIAMLAIILSCIIAIICIFIPSCEGQSVMEDAGDRFTQPDSTHTVNVSSDGVYRESVESAEFNAFITTDQPEATDPEQTDPDSTATATDDSGSDGDSDGDSDDDSGSQTLVTPDPNADADPNDYVVQRISVNFNDLIAINSDAVAWLYLQDSPINYPVMMAPADNPGFYLDHLYDKSENIIGSLYVDPLTDVTFSAKNTIIHGHRMNNGSMFGTLNRYKKQTYYNGNPIMQLYTPDGQTDYYIYIFAAYETDLGSYYRTSFYSSEDFEEYLQTCIGQSVIDTLVTPTADDTIITLSTCVLGNDLKRMVVQGILVPMD
ncbi:MAG: class B sortase [Clostridia bacterium]|nr:class B sortase [Clostridia bacterium]